MDSDLAESVAALISIFERRGIPFRTGKADPNTVAELKKILKLPLRYRNFLLHRDPIDLETRSPLERIVLFPSTQLLAEQRGFCLDDNGNPRQGDSPTGWRKTWVIIGRSSLLGDPYFIDTAKTDAEGDCGVYTAMSGKDRWVPVLCATNFAMFLKILATSMELAQGFGDAAMDEEDERVFRQSMAHKIKAIDPAAVRAGHWS